MNPDLEFETTDDPEDTDGESNKATAFPWPRLEKLGFENRNEATVQALDDLSKPKP
jgi:hypothetical protein